MVRIVLSAPLVAIAVVAMGCGGRGTSSPSAPVPEPVPAAPQGAPSQAPSPAPEKPPAVATWVELGRVAGEFESNQIAAERSYNGQRVRVRCMVNQVKRGAGGAAEVEAAILTHRSDVLFRFASAQDGEVAQVRRGQLVVVEGTVKGRAPGYVVVLADCRVRPYQFGELATPKPTVTEVRHQLNSKSQAEVRQLIGPPDRPHKLTKRSTIFSCDAYDNLCRSERDDQGNPVTVYVVYIVTETGRVAFNTIGEPDPNTTW